MQFPVSEILKPYVKGYWIFSTGKGMANEVFYPSGYVDFAINISDGAVTTIIDGQPISMPQVEILGQITVPTRLMVAKGTAVLIARIYPYANSLFFSNQISEFTNQSIDVAAVLGKQVNKLYENLIHAVSIEQKIGVLEAFLVQQLEKSKVKKEKVAIVKNICSEIYSEDEFFNIRNLSQKYGISERYIQKLFLDNVGIAPRAFFNIQRFNRSLEFIQKADLSLTSIAYECGYYDQAHFIKEFRKFTGLTPSDIRSLNTVG